MTLVLIVPQSTVWATGITTQALAVTLSHTAVSVQHAGKLTMLPCILGCTHTLLWCDGMWHCSGTDISVGSCCHRWNAHIGLHSASRGSQVHRCMLRWWGYTVPCSYTDSDFCSADPSDHDHMLHNDKKLLFTSDTVKKTRVWKIKWSAMRDSVLLWFYQ